MSGHSFGQSAGIYFISSKIGNSAGGIHLYVAIKLRIEVPISQREKFLWYVLYAPIQQQQEAIKKAIEMKKPKH